MFYLISYLLIIKINITNINALYLIECLHQTTTFVANHINQHTKNIASKNESTKSGFIVIDI